jgi:hypothetical protein
MIAVSVETKAKQDFQKLKDDTERKKKDSVSKDHGILRECH